MLRLKELTVPELTKISQLANFDNEELLVFQMCSQGKTDLEIAFAMCMSDRTVSRRKQAIKRKIERILYDS